MGEDQLVAAQMEFQARLAALHAAQGRLAEAEARLRRLDIDRDVFGAVDEAGRVRAEVQRDHARAEVEQLRAAARDAHTRLVRLSGPGYEPDQVEFDPPPSGYQQPPFAGAT
jgi:outer membrane protein TolC